MGSFGLKYKNRGLKMQNNSILNKAKYYENVNNVKREVELYAGMCDWLEIYLNDKYRTKKM